MSESDNTAAPQVPPLGRRGLEPDATAPDGSEIRLLLDERHHAEKASMVEVALAAGQVSRPMRHRQVEELWYVLEGRGQVWRCPPDAGTASVPAVSVVSGDALVIPVGWSFQFSVAHDSTLRLLCVTIPPWPGEEEAVPVPGGVLGPPTV